jgi:hypothetical protein
LGAICYTGLGRVASCMLLLRHCCAAQAAPTACSFHASRPVTVLLAALSRNLKPGNALARWCAVIGCLWVRGCNMVCFGCACCAHV